MLQRLALFLIAALLSWPAQAVSVAFINPGRSTEAFWLAASNAMAQASQSLGIRLEVLYAEREHLRGLELVKALVARPVAERPDYLLFSNDYGTAPEMLRLVDGSGIRVLLVFSAIHGVDQRQVGRPREKYPFWLGSLEPDAEEAGYLTAKSLIEKGRQARLQGSDGLLHLLALAGDRSTPSSAARNSGLQRALAEAPDVVLDQLVYANWNLDKAAEKTRWLIRRHPEARLLWSGSDQIAFGAMKAWRERGGTPGRDGLFSGVNTSTQAMEAIQRGELSALAGGHFLAGAWGLVMVHDHARGRDFSEEGLDLVRPMFTLFNPERARYFVQRFGGAQLPLDFRQYSKALNPRVQRYQFDVAVLLR